MKFLLVSLFFLSFTLPIFAKTNPNCLSPWYIDGAPGEPNFERGASEYRGYSDTVMTDTCRPVNRFNDVYARERLFIEFHENYADIVPVWIRQSDTTVDFTWEDLSTVYPTIRSTMQVIGQRFGSYKMRRYAEPPEGMPTVSWGGYQMIFEDYTNMDSVSRFVAGIHPTGEVTIQADMVVVTAVPDTKSNVLTQVNISIFPNPSTDKIVVKTANDVSTDVQYIHLYDHLGNIVKQFNGQATMLPFSFDAHGLPSGVYWCMIYFATGNVSSSSIVIVR